jgi:myo-inositol 2-dehydrogenase / D-chiro-inositol 1-dehydrogenase
MTTDILGVGFIGAGPVTQAIHLPVVSGMPDRLRVAHVMDIDAGTAASVAARVGARSSTTVTELLADDAVDVVAICSPHTFHAEQIEAVAAAGKRGVLCEKPLATTVEEATRIARASAAAGIPVVVGAMHAYDPAWVAAAGSWGDLADTATLVRSAIYLPTNDEFVELATEPAAAAAPAAAPAAPPAAPPSPADLVRMGILGLATHTVPHLRAFFPAQPEVVSARYVAPWGYHILLTGEGRIGEVLALMPGAHRPDWTFSAWSASARLTVDYPPSYVLAGSARAVLQRGSQSDSWQFAQNGYQAEWAQLADAASGRSPLRISVGEAVDDLFFALALADGCDRLMGVAA